jgi:hypothetical protein|tara:strand:- start:1509 stop:1706 length:198 start_codon:yes stop_codon:yes gene_type:complete
MNELGQGFFAGLFTLYVLAIPLLLHMVEAEDEEADPRGPLKFAFMWPFVAMQVVYMLFIGEREDD